MLVATFGPTTKWFGKTVTYSDGVFVLEGHGPIRAQDVFEYERQGHLVWSMDGIRAWVGARAHAEGGLTAAPSQTAEWQADRSAAADADEPAKTEPHFPSAGLHGAIALSGGATFQPRDAVEPLGELEIDDARRSDEAANPVQAADSAHLVPAAETAGAVAAMSAADHVLAAEPADVVEIAASTGLAASTDVGGQASPPGPAELPADELEAPAAVDPAASAVTSEDGFGCSGADDPARARQIEEAARKHDWARLAALYELQAWWLDEEGRDALQVTRLARRAELRALAEQGVAQVWVAAADEDTCAACRRVGGRVMTVADALRRMPIPNASCAYKWCRCRWEPADGDAPR